MIEIRKVDFLNIEIDNINVNYIDIGSGDNLILLHGWGSNIKLFNLMINALKDSFRVIALDMPGFGETPEPPESMDVGQYTDFVIKFIEKLGIEKSSILGHSFGGRVIIKMMSKDKLPFEIDKIILVDSAGIKPKKSFTTNMKIKSFKLAKKMFDGTILGKMYPNFVENMRSKSGSSDYNMASPLMRQALVKVVNEDLTDLLPNIKNETLLIWGDMDDATPISDAHIMNKAIKNSGLVVVKGAGHYSYIEQAPYVNNAIKSFLSN